MPDRRYASISEFYPDYLGEHSHPTNRRLHFAGTGLAIADLIAAIALRRPTLLAAAPVLGYGFAWAGHFFVEKNRPATFRHPFFSLACDFVMFWHLLTGRRPEDQVKVK